MIYTVYEDDKGNLYRVSSGLTNGTDWMTVRNHRRGYGSHRVKSKNLPIRNTMKAAQDDLDAYAKRYNFRTVEAVEGVDGTAQ